MTDLIKPADKKIWDAIENADLKVLDGDKSIYLTSMCFGEDTTTLCFERDEGEEYNYEFANDCLTVTHRNRVTLTDIEGEKIVIDCFNYTPADFPL